MKKSIFLFPLISVWLLLGSCGNDQVYNYQSSFEDAEDISEVVNNAIREALADAVSNDTIFGSDSNLSHSNGVVSDTMLVKTGVLQIPEIKVSINNNEKEWIELQREENEYRSDIATVSVVFPCVMLMFIAFLLLLFFYLRLRSRNKVIAKAIEANYQLPPEFYSNTQSQPKGDAMSTEVKTAPSDGTVPPPLPRNERLRVSGLRLAAIGLGMMIMLGVWGGMSAAVLGVIPLLIGGSYLATYYNVLK